MRKQKKYAQNYNWHHRRAKANGGKKSEVNLVQVPIVQHRAWHTLFGVKTPAEIASIINETWLDPEWEMVAQKRNKGDETKTTDQSG